MLPELSERDIDKLYDSLTIEQRANVEKLLMATQSIWIPLPDVNGHPSPQRQAAESPADVILYGGAAGGGKTDLSLGLAITEHHRTLFVRREGTQLEGAKDRMADILGSRDGLNSQTGIWRMKREGREDGQVRFAGVPNPGDEWKHQGNPRDLLVLDEAANLLESQARALMGWVRDATDQSSRQRVLLCSNPPTNAEGRWMITYFAPWLDKDHPLYPTAPGDLRWCAMMPDGDIWVDGPDPFVLDDGLPVYDFSPDDYTPEEIIQPMSRTFIPSRVTDNPHLMASGYMRTLQAMPEPLRSQMLYGDFMAGIEDDVMQVLPTAWVQAAMDRWKPRSDEFKPGHMTSMGVDPSRGGRDESVISRRHGSWYDELIRMPGEAVPDGPTLGARVLMHRKDTCPVHVDVIGIGSSVVDWLTGQAIQVVPVTGSESSSLKDINGMLGFYNMRAELYWLFREALDPQHNSTVALPPDRVLLADLTAPTFEVRAGNKIIIESKKEIAKRIGRSTDSGDTVVYASIHTTPRDIQIRRPNRGGKPRVKRAL